MRRGSRVLLVAAALMAAPAAACTILLGASDVPTPDDGGAVDSTTGTDTGVDARPDVAEAAADSVANDAGPDRAEAESGCTPSSTRCEGPQPEQCEGDGLWHASGPPCTYACVDAGCTGICVPTAKQCFGQLPETCSAVGQWVEAGAPCPFICDAGTCVGSCAPNTVVCGTSGADAGGSGQSVDTCDGTGHVTSVPCKQPNPDCVPSGGSVACGCAGQLCGGSCAQTQTDPANCGACGHDCLGGTCVGGVCQPVVLASNQQGPADIAIDGTNAYWVNSIGGTVMACALAGCNDKPTVLASGQASPVGVAVAGAAVYWVDSLAADGGVGGSVMTCATSGCGGAPTALSAVENTPTSIAVSGGTAFWTGSATRRCSTSACSPVSVGPGGARVAVDSSNVYWTAATGPVRCAVGGCGGSPTPIATGQFGPWAIAVDSANVYWSDIAGTLGVHVCPLTGCTGSTLLSPAPGEAYDVAVDATDVYWVELTSGNVLKCALTGCGGKPTAIAAQPNSNPSGIAVDAKAVYWVQSTSPGAVMKVAK